MKITNHLSRKKESKVRVKKVQPRQKHSSLSTFCPNAPGRAESGEKASLFTPVPSIMPKLLVGDANDPLEREADRAADQVVSIPEIKESSGRVPGVSRSEVSVQRTCQTCSSDDEKLRRKPAGEVTESSLDLTPSIERLPGRALSSSERTYFEPRFGKGFDDIRLHTGADADRAAKSVNAKAFTFRNHIVFRSNEYNSAQTNRRRLLAHELAHTLQQGQGRQKVVRRDVTLPPPRICSEDFSWNELNAYLDALRRENGPIRGRRSDDRARAIVRFWSMGSTQCPFELSARDKALLIRQMISGLTLNEDERAILEILERSTVDELRDMFLIYCINSSVLESNFHGTERLRLGEFFFRRFGGGLESVRGRNFLDLRGEHVPIGAPLPPLLLTRYAGEPVEDRGDLPPHLQPIDLGLMERAYILCDDEDLSGPFHLYRNSTKRCCYPSMLREIDDARRLAIVRVFHAAARLSSSPRSVWTALSNHFRVQPWQTEYVLHIIDYLENLLHTLRQENIKFYCRDYERSSCKPASSSREDTRLYGRSGSSCEDGDKRILICGNYDESIQFLSNVPFLPELRGRGFRTVLHEYVHASCVPTLPHILGGEHEIYADDEGYPGTREQAILNPDSYVGFVIAVT